MESKFLVKWSLSGQGSLRKLLYNMKYLRIDHKLLTSALGARCTFCCPAGCESSLPFPRHTDFLSSGGRWPTVTFSAIPRHREPCGYSLHSRLSACLAAEHCPVQQGSWLSKMGRMRDWRSASLRQARQRLPPELPVTWGREGALSPGQRQDCWIRLSFCLPVKPDLLLPGS